jgi:hypothetical protein
LEVGVMSWEAWPDDSADVEHAGDVEQRGGDVERRGNGCWWWRSGDLAICLCNRARLVAAIMVALLVALLLAVLFARREARH